jgi:molybdenum cofactor cytidylyltransferase
VSGAEGVILAAGFSERAGQFKMTLPLGDRTILEMCIKGMISVCDRTIVVGGYNYDKIKEIVADIPDVEFCYNKNFEMGMFTSVKRGIREIKAGRFFIIPGDQPLVKPDTYRMLLAVDADIVIPRYKSKKGHPVLFQSHLIEEILAMPDEAILRDFIHSKNAVCIDLDDRGILLDVDNPADYKTVIEYFKKEAL